MKNLFLYCCLLYTGFTFGQPQGIPDGDFDTDGLVQLNLLGNYSLAGMGVFVQPDGKILAAATAYDNNGKSNVLLARYLPDGSFDHSFGTYFEGVTIDSIYAAYLSVNALAVDLNGDLLVAGGAIGKAGLAKFSPTGHPLVFGNLGGMALTNFGIFTSNSHFYAAAFQPDGKIIAAGQEIENNTGNFAVARYFPDGQLDTTFSFDGKVVTDFFGGDDGANAIAGQADGKIIAAGQAGHQFALVRYQVDGTLDNSFGTNGKVTQSIGSESIIKAMVLQPDGRILVAGYSVNGDQSSTVARFNTDGTLDNSFGSGGIFTWPAGYFTSLVLQPDGKIIAVGSPTNIQAFAAMRLLANGTLDPSFGQGGQALYWVFGAANAAALQPDGKIVVVGTLGDAANGQLAIARYLSSFSVGTINPTSIIGESLIYPNPVANTATFDFTLEIPAAINLSVVNMQGQLQQSVVTAAFPSGKHEIPLTLGQLPPGSYRLVLRAGAQVVSTQFIKD